MADYKIEFLSDNQIDISKRSGDGKLIGSFAVGLSGVYEALDMYQEYLSKQPFNAELKNNSASF